MATAQLSKEFRLVAVWIGGQLKWIVPLPTIRASAVIHNGTVQVIG